MRDKYETDAVGKVKVQQGKRLDYLGMKLDFSEEKHVKIDMCDYVKRMIKDYPKEISSKHSKTPAESQLV